MTYKLKMATAPAQNIPSWLGVNVGIRGALNIIDEQYPGVFSRTHLRKIVQVIDAVHSRDRLAYESNMRIIAEKGLCNLLGEKSQSATDCFNQNLCSDIVGYWHHVWATEYDENIVAETPRISRSRRIDDGLPALTKINLEKNAGFTRSRSFHDQVSGAPGFSKPKRNRGRCYTTWVQSDELDGFEWDNHNINFSGRLPSARPEMTPRGLGDLPPIPPYQPPYQPDAVVPPTAPVQDEQPRTSGPIPAPLSSDQPRAHSHRCTITGVTACTSRSDTWRQVKE